LARENRKPAVEELYTEVQKNTNFEPVKSDLEVAFKHIKYIFKTQTPKVITVISEMDYNNKVIYTDSLVIISLEIIFGKRTQVLSVS
jgi:hypothetical protein